MSEREARAVMLDAYAARGLSPDAAELQLAQAVGRHEGRYGSGIAGATNNWGAVQCGARPPCPAGCAEHGDTHAGGAAYRACFRAYPTAVAGAADMLRELVRRKNVREAMRAGDAAAMARAMRAAGYFEAPAASYAAALERNRAAIANALGEPIFAGGGGRVSRLVAAVLSVATVGGAVYVVRRRRRWRGN